jgi:hypothetical protein
MQHRLIRRTVLEPDRIPDLVPQPTTDLLSHPRRDGHGGDSTRLGAGDLEAVCGVAGFVEILRELSRLAGASLGFDDEDLVVGDGLEKVVAVRVDGKGFSDGSDGFGWEKGGGRGIAKGVRQEMKEEGESRGLRGMGKVED